MTYETDRHPPPTSSGPVIEDHDPATDPVDPERDIDSSTADADADGRTDVVGDPDTRTDDADLGSDADDADLRSDADGDTVSDADGDTVSDADGDTVSDADGDTWNDPEALADQSRVVYPEDSSAGDGDGDGDGEAAASAAPADEDTSTERVDVTDPDDLPDPEDLTDTAVMADDRDTADRDGDGVADDADLTDDDLADRAGIADETGTVADETGTVYEGDPAREAALTQADVAPAAADDGHADAEVDPTAPGFDRAEVYAVAATTDTDATIIDTTDADTTDADTTDADATDAGVPDAAGEPAATAVATESMPGGVPDEPLGALWPAQAGDGFRDRWRDLQLRFVDDPAAAAAEAEELVAEALDRFAATLADRKSELDAWRGGAGAGDTEQMRVVLRQYRDFLDRLLGL
jgi:hypothetical protein